MPQRDWSVLLIGGGSGTGKSSLSLVLGAYFGVRVLEGDDLRWAIEAAVPRDTDPALHLFSEAEAWEQPVEELVEHTLRLSRRLCQACEAVVARHMDGEAIIIEAFWVLPEFAAQPFYSGTDSAGKVRSLFLYDEDSVAVSERRAGRFGAAALDRREAAMAEHGAFIAARALDLGLPVISSQPFETLLERAIAAVSISA